MKVIDLLNKIANGEEVPKHIKHQYYDYKWSSIDKDYQKRDGEMLLGNMSIQYHLNDEIILIEDNTIDINSIEKIAIRPYEGFVNVCEYLSTKGNELIQAVKQLNKEIKEVKEK